VTVGFDKVTDEVLEPAKGKSGRAYFDAVDAASNGIVANASVMLGCAATFPRCWAAASATQQRRSRPGPAAASALSAGSGLLASQPGARLGFDDAGVSQSRTLGGSVVGFGKYLSPKLYVSYGVSLVGSGSVLTLKYLLGRGFDAEVESSTVENRGSLNWRKEK